MSIKETEEELKKHIAQLQKVIEEYILFFNHNKDFPDYVNKKYNIQKKFIVDIESKSKDLFSSITELKKQTGENFFKQIKNVLINDYGIFIELLKMFFYQIIFYTSNQNIVDFISTTDNPAFNFVGGNYLLLTMNYKNIKKLVNQFFFKDITLKDELVVDDNTELWTVSDMEHKIYPSDFYKIREYANEITECVKGKLTDESLTVLRQQISELIKNAVKHGNKNDPEKVIKIWYKFDDEYYKIIIEDQGEGFQNLEDWNDFNNKRNEAIMKQDMEGIMKYVSYKNDGSDENDGGNALFAALEYWDSGLIYNKKRNKVLAVKYFYYK